MGYYTLNFEYLGFYQELYKHCSAHRKEGDYVPIIQRNIDKARISEKSD